MEHAISEIIKIFTTMIFILLLVGMVIMGKHLSDVNSFKEYVNTQIERNGGYTQTVKTNVEKMNKDSFNNMFVVYEPDSNTPKKIEEAPFGEIVNYEIHSDIPIPFTTAGTIEIPIAFKGQAVSRIRDSADLVTHTAYANNADGTLDFTTDSKSAVGLDILNLTKWTKNAPMTNSTFNVAKNADNSFKVTGRGTAGYEVLSKSFPAKVGDKLRFTVSYTNRRAFDLWNNCGLQFVVNGTYTDSPYLTSKIVLPKEITKSTEYQLEYTATTDNVWMGLNLAGVSDDSQVDFDIKIEVENLTNPVKHTYIGTYTDKSETDSQDPSKYTWKLNPDYN